MGNSGMELNAKVAYRYGLRVEKALELLLFLAQLSGGFPPRAYELLRFGIITQPTEESGTFWLTRGSS